MHSCKHVWVHFFSALVRSGPYQQYTDARTRTHTLMHSLSHKYAHTHAHTHSAPLHVSDDLAAAWRMVESQRVAQKVQEEAAQRVAAHKEQEEAAQRMAAHKEHEDAAQRVSHTAQEDAPERVFARKVREEAEMRVLAALKAVGASSPTLRQAAGVMAVAHHIDSE
jgi:hypothetical protein